MSIAVLSKPSHSYFPNGRLSCSAQNKKGCPYGQVLLIFRSPDRHLFGQSLTVCQGCFGCKCRREELGDAMQTTFSYLARRSSCIAQNAVRRDRGDPVFPHHVQLLSRHQTNMSCHQLLMPNTIRTKMDHE